MLSFTPNNFPNPKPNTQELMAQNSIVVYNLNPEIE